MRSAIRRSSMSVAMPCRRSISAARKRALSWARCGVRRRRRRRPAWVSEAGRQPNTAAAQAAGPRTRLSRPPGLLVAVLQWLSPHGLARVERVARAFRGPPSYVGQALRQRAAERGAVVPVALPAGEASWVQYLSWCDRLAALPHSQRLAAGARHSAFVDASGQLLTCGTEEEDEDGDEWEHPGLLGHGPDVTILAVPTPVTSLVGTRVESVSVGRQHSLVLTEAGAVLSFGLGELGQLGHGDDERQHTPKVIEALRGERVVAVAGGQCHYVCVLQDGRAFGWGVSEDETLGLQLTDDQLKPLEYPTLRL